MRGEWGRVRRGRGEWKGGRRSITESAARMRALRAAALLERGGSERNAARQGRTRRGGHVMSRHVVRAPQSRGMVTMRHIGHVAGQPRGGAATWWGSHVVGKPLGRAVTWRVHRCEDRIALEDILALVWGTFQKQTRAYRTNAAAAVRAGVGLGVRFGGVSRIGELELE